MLRRAVILGVGLLLLLLLYWLCIRTHVPRFERHFQAQASERLTAAGLTSVATSFNGRYAALAGTVGSEERKARAVGLVRGIPGVRRVDDRELRVSAPPPEPLPQASSTAGGRLQFEHLGNRIRISGVVPSAEQEQGVLSAAEEVYGIGRVDDGVEVQAGIGEMPWLGRIPDLLGWMRRGGLVRGSSVSLADTGVQISGQVLGDRQEDVRQRLAAIVPGMEISGDLQAADESTLEGAEARIGLLLQEGVIEFETSQAVLSSTGRQLLDRLAEPLQRVPNAVVEIAGHTDSRGEEAANQELSERRAQAVVDYLVSRGVERQRMQAVGYGESRPIATNQTPEGRQRNRRIEFRVSRES